MNEYKKNYEFTWRVRKSKKYKQTDTQSERALVSVMKKKKKAQ
jgi:hypothetical protein